jgi:hypothetical protein
MYLDLDACDNLPEPVMATFQATGPAQAIHAVRLHLEGTWQWCAVVGWNETPAQAWLTPIEESGDGVARLIHGDAQGLRLQRIADPSQASAVRWDVRDSQQWGEPFLICTPEIETA